MKTYKKVMFCIRCMKGIECKSCDKTFDKEKRFQTTTVHQISKDITVYQTDSTQMICDLGCPNTVIGIGDMDRFVSNLSEFQKERLEIIQVDEKFKFGPSGPFKCSEKLRFPIKNRMSILWVEVALVKAKIPMLLGNNVFKPLRAQINLFPGGGLLVLDGKEIHMKETNGGHYAIKVSDLGKLSDDVEQLFGNDCKTCENDPKEKEFLSLHMKTKHGRSDMSKVSEEHVIKSAMKNTTMDRKTTYEDIIKDIEGENTREKVITDLNTLLNSSPSTIEKKLILITKNLALQNCDNCEKGIIDEKHLEKHMVEKHEEQAELVFLSHHEQVYDDYLV